MPLFLLTYSFQPTYSEVLCCFSFQPTFSDKSCAIVASYNFIISLNLECYLRICHGLSPQVAGYKSSKLFPSSVGRQSTDRKYGRLKSQFMLKSLLKSQFIRYATFSPFNIGTSLGMPLSCSVAVTPDVRRRSSCGVARCGIGTVLVLLILGQHSRLVIRDRPSTARLAAANAIFA